jgi:hypothetical protein
VPRSANPVNLTPAERTLRAQIAAHAGWALTEDRTARTQPGRDAMLRKFENQVDPDRKLTPAERAKRVENARKAYYQKLSFKAHKARRRRAAAREGGGDAA